MKKLTLANKEKFFSTLKDGDKFSYSSSFLYSDVKEIGVKYMFHVIYLDGFNCMVEKINHYHYLDLVIPLLFNKLAEKTSNKYLSWHYYPGIISAHGDKFYSYRDYFNKNGLTFFHGVAIGLLSYVNPYAKECRETKDGFIPVESWIVKNKDKFLPLILEVEKSVFKV